MISTEIGRGSFFANPFPYYVAGKGLTDEASAALLSWFQADAPWRLVEAEFYEQYEFDLQKVDLPPEIEPLRTSGNLLRVKNFVESTFGVALSEQIDLTAHKLLPGQTIRVHNDYIPGAETHRVLIQLNDGWADENGGLLIFFERETPPKMHRALRPLHNSCVAFSIGPNSLHAVSTIVASERYTLVYSFYQAH